MMTNKGKRFPPEPLTEAEAQQLVDAIKGNGVLAVRNRALVALLWTSALRITEALALKPADVDLNVGAINVLEGKGRKAGVSHIDGRAVGYLSAWLEVRKGLGLNGRQRLFCSVSSGDKRKPGEPMDPSYVRRWLPKLAATAGIDKRAHPHGLRHTHASEMIERNVPINVISGELRHSDVASTAKYVDKINPAARRKAMRDAGFTMPS